MRFCVSRLAIRHSNYIQFTFNVLAYQKKRPLRSRRHGGEDKAMLTGVDRGNAPTIAA